MSPKVLVVCLGNICRSPMGEAVLRDIAKERKIDLTVDSAGTAAYHVGEEPDDRSVYDDPPQAFTRH
jgi:low molecular weight phosphotyrosine protein phosphatase